MRRTLAAVAATALLALTACSSSDGDGGGDSAGASAQYDESASEAPAEPEALTAYDEDGAADPARADVVSQTAPDAEARSVISTGDVALRSKDVAQAVLDVRRVVDTVAGRVETDQAETDRKGALVRSQMVIRVPSASFDEAMQALKGTATLVSSGADSKDVTTEVLDVDVRVRVQRRSIERIALLLDRAESIRDIVSIEAQLSQRQADLAALERKQTVLASQTSMSTISVSVERTEKKPAADEREQNEAGFLTGLDAGWDALRTFGVGFATFLGAVLPWTLVLLVLAVPGVPLLRRLRRRPAAPPTAPAA